MSTPDNMEQKAREWWDKYAEDADTHNTHPADHCAAFARSLAPLHLSMTEEEIERIGNEYRNRIKTHDISDGLDEGYIIGIKTGLRYTSTHTKTITVDRIIEVVSEYLMANPMKIELTDKGKTSLGALLTAKFK